MCVSRSARRIAQSVRINFSLASCDFMCRPKTSIVTIATIHCRLYTQLHVYMLLTSFQIALQPSVINSTYHNSSNPYLQLYVAFTNKKKLFSFIFFFFPMFHSQPSEKSCHKHILCRRSIYNARITVFASMVLI